MLCLVSLKGGKWATNRGGLWEEVRVWSVTPISRLVQTAMCRTFRAGEGTDSQALLGEMGPHCLPLCRARAAPAGPEAARSGPSCAGLGGVFRGAGRSGEGGDPDAAAVMRGVGTNLHALVMRGVRVSVPSLVTPSRLAPPPGGQTPPLGRASPLGSLFPEGAAPSGCPDPPGLFCDPSPNPVIAPTPPWPVVFFFFPLMAFRRLPFSTDFIFLFPNHICLSALSKLCQRREISSWLVSTAHSFSYHTGPISSPDLKSYIKDSSHRDTPVPRRLLGQVWWTRDLQQGARLLG